MTLFDGQGAAYDAAISKCARGEVSVQVRSRRDEDRESPLQVTLAQAVSSGERMDLTLQKSVELGVAVIQPLMMRRSVVRLSGDKADKRLRHWRGIVISACEQCGRNQLPPVAEIAEFVSWLSPSQSSKRQGFRLER